MPTSKLLKIIGQNLGLLLKCNDSLMLDVIKYIINGLLLGDLCAFAVK